MLGHTHTRKQIILTITIIFTIVIHNGNKSPHYLKASRNGHINTHTENCILHNWYPWKKPASICIHREPRVNRSPSKHIHIKICTYECTLQTQSSMWTGHNTQAHKGCSSNDEQYDSLTYLTLWSVPSVCSSALLFSVSLTHSWERRGKERVRERV